MLQKALRVTKEISREAGELLLDNLPSSRSISQKEGDATNLVTEMDTRSEKLIINRLSSEFPDHDYIAEEGTQKTTGSTHYWLIDPLDGTNNYAHSFPFFAVSISLQKAKEPDRSPFDQKEKFQDRVLLGVVYIPYMDALYTAVEGEGAYCNGNPIQVSDREPLSDAMIATGFPYTRRTTDLPVFRDFENMTRSSRSIRRAGAAAIDLCYLAHGIFDGFWEWNLAPWDTSAGCKIVREAGGETTDFNGAPHNPFGQKTLASNGRIHSGIQQVLNSGKPLIEQDKNNTNNQY